MIAKLFGLIAAPLVVGVAGTCQALILLGIGSAVLGAESLRAALLVSLVWGGLAGFLAFDLAGQHMAPTAEGVRRFLGAATRACLISQVLAAALFFGLASLGHELIGILACAIAWLHFYPMLAQAALDPRARRGRSF